jgi:nitronate monooxygenase
VVATESAAPAAHRAAILGAPGRHTRLVAAISGRPARSVQSNWTKLVDEVARDGVQVAVYPNAYDLGKQLHAVASKTGDQGWGAFWAGQGAPLAREMGGAELVATLVREMEA